jgi:hypothetical protein
MKNEMEGLKKTNTNPFFKSKFFDINDILLHVEPLLQKNNLVLIQPIIDNSVCSQIWDLESGEYIESKMELSNIIDPQKRGSEISYFRRYTLQSMLSLQAIDDDAQKAVQKPKATEEILRKAKEGNFTIEQVKTKYSLTTEQEKSYGTK